MRRASDTPPSDKPVRISTEAYELLKRVAYDTRKPMTTLLNEAVAKTYGDKGAQK